jgi:hypothetical protein
MTPIHPNPPAVVRESDSLGELAAQINSAHAAGEEASRKGLAFFRQTGAMLHRAKAMVPHGGWLDWLRRNVAFSVQSASNYMRIADNWERVSGASGLQDALRALAEDAREEPELPTVGNSEPEQTAAGEEVAPAEVEDEVGSDLDDNPRVPVTVCPPVAKKERPRKLDWVTWQRHIDQLKQAIDHIGHQAGKSSNFQQAHRILHAFENHLTSWRSELDARSAGSRGPGGG